MNSATLPASAALSHIEDLAKVYASARGVVADRLQHHHEEIAAVQRRLLPGIKTAAMVAAGAKGQLEAAIEAHRDCFVQPRTLTLHGIKLGLVKGKGSIDWADDEKLAERIAKLLPDQAEVLVKTTHKPIAKALLALDTATLKKLGCTVEGTGDCVFIKAVEVSGLEKLVEKLLAEGEGEEIAG